MFGRRITLFKLLGFEVKLDASWLILAALIVWSLAVGFFPYRYRGFSAGTYWWMGVFGAVGLFASIVFHELFHSLVARRYGLPMRGITLFIFGGVSEMSDEPSSAKVEFLMAIAGPLSSIGLGFLFYGIVAAARGAWPLSVLGVIAYLGWINWVLAGFNLIPAFPLDGGRVLRAALWQWKGDFRRATQIAAAIGAGFGVFLMVLAVFQLFTGNFVGAVWSFFIGMFLRGASMASYEQVLIRSALAGVPVRRFMRADPITVRPDLTVQELVDDYIYRYHHRMFPVASDAQECIGSVSAEQVKQLPREEWPRHRVSEILQPCSTANTVDPNTDATKALAKMNSGATRLLVVDGKRLVGLVSSRDLLTFLSTKVELEGGHVPVTLPPGTDTLVERPEKTRTASG
jgi:Zn-dependent protease